VNKLIFGVLLIAAAICAVTCACASSGQHVEISLEEAAPTPEPTPAPYVTDDIFVVTCEDSINFRERSSASSELIRTLENGEEVRILGYESQRFAKVEAVSTGEVGYAIAGYLQAKDYSLFGLDTVQVTDKYTYEQMQQDIAALKAKYPDKLAVDSIGTSLQGRDIPVLILGDKNAEKHIFIQSAIHGREHMTSLLAMALTENYLKGKGGEVCFHIVPMANPDGVTIAQSEVIPKEIMEIYTNDGRTGRSVDTGAVYLSQWQANSRGVDLNRNFDAKWDEIKTCPLPSFMNYRGDSFESEPEARALVEYTKKNDFDVTISYHATGSTMFWEFGDNLEVNAASLELARFLESETAYEPMGNEDGSCGGYKDWVMDKLGIPSLTVEIGTCPAPLMESEFSNVWLRNRRMLENLEKWVINR